MVPELLGALASPTPLLVLLVALAGAPATAIVGWRRPRAGAVAAVISATTALLLVVAAWHSGGGSTSLPWVPTWGLRLSLTFDGLSAVYALLATGIGAAVLAYSAAYLPRRLDHLRRDANEATSFYALILLFMGAMVGLVVADDLLLLFIFWDLTAVVSYFLIGFDRDEPSSRPAALMALMVTGGAAILMLAGIVAFWIDAGTTSVSELNASAAGGLLFSLSVGAIVLAALAKSAQMPLHFWLPRAMVAPTPVSSYLHSAAMVAAGVFLLARMLPLVHRAEWVAEILVVVGLTSTLTGGFLAIGRDDMKRVLAYSTIGQYGYVVVLLGLGGAYGAIGAGMYVLAHAVAKCALFLTAGAVTEATGRKRLSELGGLFRSMPVVAMASAVAAATIAALPLTMGFFKDELFFAAMYRRGPLLTLAAVLSAALTFAYVARFWGRIFLGRASDRNGRVPFPMVGAIVLLATLCIAGGIWIDPANQLANAAGSAALMEPVSVRLAYHLDTRPENLMALAAYAIGLTLVVTVVRWARISRGFGEFAARFGPDRIYQRTLEATNELSDRVHGYEVHDLRGRVAWVLLPVGVLVLLGLVFTSNDGAFIVGELRAADSLVILVLAVVCGAAVTATQTVQHLAALLLLSAVGFPLAAVYAFLGAPDVALVAVLMETLLSLMFIGFLAAMRDRPRVVGFETASLTSHRWRDILIGLAAAATAFVVVWGVLSKPAAVETAAQDQIALTPAAHARDVVTAILSDFRGLDTMGEITVIGITMIGLVMLLQRPLQRRARE